MTHFAPHHPPREGGFVLMTVMVLLALLSLMGVAQLYRSIALQQESGVSTMNMRAAYYAETGIGYMQWAWANNARFNSSGSEGDKVHWLSKSHDPATQVEYWDNRAKSARTTNGIFWASDTCVATPDAAGCNPILSGLSADLTNAGIKYVKLDINQSTGAITPTLTSDGSVPTNGAIVWLTAGSETSDAVVANTACSGSASTETGCYNNGTNNVPYHVVAYGLGFVGGRPLHLLRAIIY